MPQRSGVHIVPDVGMNAVVMVGFPLVQWDIVRQQRQQRGDQAGHTELTDKVSFAGVADSNAVEAVARSMTPP